MPPWVEQSVADRFRGSLDRCLADEGFLARFYLRFLPSHASVEAKFAKTDFASQMRALRASLHLVTRAAEGHEDGRVHLRAIARTHSRRGYGIEPFHYELWLEALIGVARETDDRFDDAVEQAWRLTLGPCIAAMQSATGA